jgi:type IX secretion system PorP/SprF family membrane protein
MAGAKLFAQDPQFTQFYNTSVYLNPAFTGLTDKHRFAVNYRNQWPGIKRSYTSYLVAYDCNVSKFNSGIGGFVVQDVIGTSNMVTTIGGLNLSYRVKTGKNSEARGGLTAAFGQQKIDNSKLVFNDQLITGASVSQDAANINNKSYLDLGFGAVFKSKNLWAGVSAKHINKPNISMTGGNDVLPAYYSLHGGYSFIIQKSDTGKGNAIQSLNLVMNYMHQLNNNQLDIGAYYFYKLVNLGVLYRGLPFGGVNTSLLNHESIAILSGVQVPGINLKIGYSYDFTISGLSFKNTVGAHEITMIYEMGKESKPKLKVRNKIIKRKF